MSAYSLWFIWSQLARDTALAGGAAYEEAVLKREQYHEEYEANAPKRLPKVRDYKHRRKTNDNRGKDT